MKHKMLKSVAVLGTVGLASLLLVACGNKNNKSASSGDGKNLTVYVEKQYEGYMKKAAAAFEKESGTKVTIKTGDQLKGLENLSLDNQSSRRYDVSI